ncbi:transporter substrate-binding domain-containing protein [Gammaproteobacteria bacterium AS21]
MIIKSMEAKIIIKKWLSILLALTIFSSPQLVFAEKLKLGIFKFSPWGMSENNEIRGIIWEYYQAILKEADLEADITLVPYPRMIKKLVDGTLDCAIFTKNFEPFQNIVYLYDLTAVAMSRKGTVISSYDDFSDKNKIKSVGFANGTDRIFPRLFNDTEIAHHIFPSLLQAPQMLARKRVDVVIGMKYTMLYEFKRQQLLDIVQIPWYEIRKVPVWFQCSNHIKISPATIERFKVAALKIKADGVFEEIAKKWLPSEVPQSDQH